MAAICRIFGNWWGALRQFASHGQLLDLSVALVIGDVFTKVIKSFVDDIITPVLGFLFDGIDIANLIAKLQSDRWPHKAPVDIRYGRFLQQLIYFAVVTLVLSVLVATINKLYAARRRAQLAKEQLPTRQELILTEHTNLLKAILQAHKT